MPGAVDGWCRAHADHGRLPLGRDLAAAIEYARDGFPVTRRLAHWTARAADDLAANRRGGAPLSAGAVGRLAPARDSAIPTSPGRSSASRASGRAGFYEGETAAEMARYSRSRGGFFDERDFAAQRAEWGEPLRATYRGVTIYETPPPTQGLSVLQMLGLVEPWELGRLEYLGPDHVHLLVQAKMIAYHDRDRFIADPAFVDVPVERLLSRASTSTSAGA